ncbi:MAG: hypothetical protein M3250_04620 [Thermoproteota archaeon]|jgi:hypothetical protein|nr:hypothetical protein [Thermoproteota archaeon]
MIIKLRIIKKNSYLFPLKPTNCFLLLERRSDSSGSSKSGGRERRKRRGSIVFINLFAYLDKEFRLLYN